MDRPDPSLLDPARYPFHCRIDPRFTDIDVNRHINNVAMCDLLQEGRVRFHRASGYFEAVAGQASSMAASFAVAYLNQAHYPQPLDCYVAARVIGRTSQTVSHCMVQDGRPVAYAEAVIVTVVDGRPHPNPAPFAEAIAPWMLRA